MTPQVTKRKRETSTADPTSTGTGRSLHFKPDILLLRFDYTDHPTLNQEIDDLHKSFESKGCTASVLVIPMKNSWDSIRPTVLSHLSVYEHGQARNKIIILPSHGGWSVNTGLSFSSHNVPRRMKRLRSDILTLLRLHAEQHANSVNQDMRDRQASQAAILIEGIKQRYQSEASFQWSHLKGLIRSAKCHVLVVLDCCAAGGALFSQSDNQIDRFERSEKYAKSVIYACPWKRTTTGELSTALLQVINNWRPDTTNLSAGTIVEDVGLILATKMLKAQRELTKENRGDKRSDCSDGERSLSQPGLFDLHSARDDGTKEQFLLTGR